MYSYKVPVVYVRKRAFTADGRGWKIRFMYFWFDVFVLYINICAGVFTYSRLYSCSEIARKITKKKTKKKGVIVGGNWTRVYGRWAHKNGCVSFRERFYDVKTRLQSLLRYYCSTYYLFSFFFPPLFLHTVTIF